MGRRREGVAPKDRWGTGRCARPFVLEDADGAIGRLARSLFDSLSLEDGALRLQAFDVRARPRPPTLRRRGHPPTYNGCNGGNAESSSPPPPTPDSPGIWYLNCLRKVRERLDRRGLDSTTTAQHDGSTARRHVTRREPSAHGFEKVKMPVRVRGRGARRGRSERVKSEKGSIATMAGTTWATRIMRVILSGCSLSLKARICPPFSSFWLAPSHLAPSPNAYL